MNRKPHSRVPPSIFVTELLSIKWLKRRFKLRPLHELKVICLLFCKGFFSISHQTASIRFEENIAVGFFVQISYVPKLYILKHNLKRFSTLNCLQLKRKVIDDLFCSDDPKTLCQRQKIFIQAICLKKLFKQNSNTVATGIIRICNKEPF